MPRRFKQSSCNTCRHRRLKCDEVKPICGQCKKAKRYCERSGRPLQVQEYPHGSTSKYLAVNESSGR
ncbi:hypothetical protein F4780DRAFT_533614 [Xylariomycetidae sp. FL0641]|nr:hypothetical protein F4780DRAFT_533614 [Xylariomycetidae sp. FL0641]